MDIPTIAFTIKRSRSKETNLTSTFQRGNLIFLYPENWLLSESDSSDDSSIHVTLESPGGGLWILSATTASTDSAAAMAEALKAVNEQFDDVEWLEISEPFYGFETTGWDGLFFSLDLLVCAKIRSFKTLDRTVVILIQAESRELEQGSDVFDAITLSLLQSLSKARHRISKK